VWDSPELAQRYQKDWDRQWALAQALPSSPP